MNYLAKELMYKLFAQYYVPNTPNSLNLKTQFNLNLLLFFFFFFLKTENPISKAFVVCLTKSILCVLVNV